MQKNFQEQLIKGKIAELIFQQMFIEDGKFTVIPFGYERILPELVKFKNKKYLQDIKNSPDFVLAYKEDNKENIFLVEVKSKSYLDQKRDFELAKEQNIRWSPSFIFIATPDRFYFDNCKNIIKNDGFIKSLSERMVSRELQCKYLKILNKFLNK